jgi:hypothetical protein
MLEESPDVFYVDVLVSNVNSNYTTTPTYAEYNETRTIPYLYNPDQYYGAVVQFNIQNTNVPILDVVIQPRQNNVNLTIYQIVLEYNGIEIFQNIIYQPQNLTVTVPLPPSSYPDGFQDNDNGYYSIYSYNYFCILLNNAFESAYNQLQINFPALPNDGQPFIKFNPLTQLFYMPSLNNSLYNQDVATPPINIYFNGALLHLFSFFPSSTVLLNNQAFEQLLINNTTTVANGNTISFTQELQSINLWSQISSLVITTQTIPIIRSQTFSPALYYAGTIEPANNNSQTQSILLEYSVENSIYTKNIVYNPSAQYKLFELTTQTPLYNLDLKFYYRSSYGILIPISLNSGSSLSVKIGFFKKSKFSSLKNLN